MTERGARSLRRTTNSFQVANSSLHWDNDRLVIEIDEIANPLPRRVRGRVVLTPCCRPMTAFDLDRAGGHIWRPIAPIADVEVELTSPVLSWRGAGYFDSNAGARPLERDFVSWHWSRARSARGAQILYDGLKHDGSSFGLSLDIGADGLVHALAPPPMASLPGTVWRIKRATRCDAGHLPRVLATYEDTPFYARSLVETQIAGERLETFHESLDLGRFVHPVVQRMLPFRMPRWR